LRSGGVTVLVRVSLVEPLIGASLAQRLEIPLMALVIVLLARWTVRRDRSGLGTAGWLLAGLSAAVGVLLADLLVGVVLRGMDVRQFLLSRDVCPGLACYGLLLVLSVALAIAARMHASTPRRAGDGGTVR
jgi:hypothetical protein